MNTKRNLPAYDFTAAKKERILDVIDSNTSGLFRFALRGLSYSSIRSTSEVSWLFLHTASTASARPEKSCCRLDLSIRPQSSAALRNIVSADFSKDSGESDRVMEKSR
ncbi:MAG: hypothetical protein SPL25_05290 [Succinivibrionaceae bacterium]|nr:hypothetical protein [Succinivibrionaceae bacterium]